MAQPTIKLVQILKGKNRMSVCDYNNNLSQGSPTPGPSGPVRNWSSEGGELHLLAQQEVSGRWASEASSVCTADLHRYRQQCSDGQREGGTEAGRREQRGGWECL